ncbi:MAG: radical SAM protein [Clostridia bacterium]|nr:radical SAM protein [Clostridia bacterium]
MVIIQPMEKNAKQFIGAPTFADDTLLRPSSFLHFAKCADGVLCFHALTKELLLLSPAEAALLTETHAAGDAAIRPFAEKHYFVEQAQDETKLADEFYAFLRLFVNRDEYFSAYRIFTTMDCNARCYYCYEMGRPRISMTQETAEKVVRFILRTKKEKKNGISLAWFGGEPLYNAEVINYITRRLSEERVTFASTMVTNGYLMRGENLINAKERWHLRRVQISLDGTEEVYNRSKAYIYKEGNPYRIVMENIDGLLDAGISVSIRLNVSAQNLQNLSLLIDELVARFGGKKGFFIYTHLLFDTDRKKFTGDDDAQLLQAKNMTALEEKLQANRLLGVHMLEDAHKITKCMADSPHAVIILPNGKLGKCEHYSEDHFIGDVENGITDRAQFLEFAASGKTPEMCGGCSFYPICNRLKLCPDEPLVCGKADKFLRQNRIERQMLKAYEKYKKAAK